MSPAAERVKWLLNKLWAGHQTRMADDIGVNQSSIGNVIHGRREPGRAMLMSIASVPLVNPAWLLTGEGSPLILEPAALIPGPPVCIAWIFHNNEGDGLILEKTLAPSFVVPPIGTCVHGMCGDTGVIHEVRTVDWYPPMNKIRLGLMLRDDADFVTPKVDGITPLEAYTANSWEITDK
jgi:hypothetical protein